MYARHVVSSQRKRIRVVVSVRENKRKERPLPCHAVEKISVDPSAEFPYEDKDCMSHHVYVSCVCVYECVHVCVLT